MGEKLELEIVGKDSTGKAWEQVEKRAKDRAVAFQNLSSPGEAFEFGEAGASKSLRGLSHISKGFKEMMEGDVLQGGAAIARGLQHSIGSAFSSIALGAVAALGTAFAGFKIGEFIEEKTHVGEKILNKLLGDPKDLEDLNNKMAESKNYIDYIAKIELSKAEKEIKKLSSAFDDVVRSADLVKQTTLGVQAALNRSRVDTFGGSADATHDAETQQYNTEERALAEKEKAAKDVIKAMESAKAKAKSDFDFYSSASREAARSGQIGAAAIYTENMKKARDAREKLDPMRDDVTKKARETLRQIASQREILQANRDASNNVYRVNKKKEDDRRSSDENKAEVEAEQARNSDKVVKLRKEQKLLERKAELARINQIEAQTNFDVERDAIQKRMKAPTSPMNVIDRIVGTPNRGALDEAAHLVDIGLNRGAMRQEEQRERNRKHQEHRAEQRLKNIMSNGQHRPLTKSEKAFLDGLRKEQQAQADAKRLAQLDEDAKKATVEAKKQLDRIRAATEATQDKIEKLLEVGG